MTIYVFEGIPGHSGSQSAGVKLVTAENESEAWEKVTKLPWREESHWKYHGTLDEFVEMVKEKGGFAALNWG